MNIRKRAPVVGPLLLLAFLSIGNTAFPQSARFFRITGPAASTITAIQQGGTIVWSNAQPGATFQVQTAASLAGGTNWLDYVQLPTTNTVTTNLIFDLNPPQAARQKTASFSASEGKKKTDK